MILWVHTKEQQPKEPKAFHNTSSNIPVSEPKSNTNSHEDS